MGNDAFWTAFSKVDFVPQVTTSLRSICEFGTIETSIFRLEAILMEARGVDISDHFLTTSGNQGKGKIHVHIICTMTTAIDKGGMVAQQ